MKQVFSVATALCASLALLTAVTKPASATLHGFCYGTSTCSDNGTNTPTTANPPSFGFTSSPGAIGLDFLVDVLVPTNRDPSPSALSFAITGTHGGTANTAAINATASLFSLTPWVSDQLDSYLKIGATPSNPIGAYTGTKNQADPSADGYYVYQADLGPTRLWSNPSSASGLLLQIGGSALPAGTYVLGFLLDGSGQKPWDATANSGAILITTDPTPVPPSPPTNVPEPATLVIMAAGLAAVGTSRLRIVPRRVV